MTWDYASDRDKEDGRGLTPATPAGGVAQAKASRLASLSRSLQYPKAR